MSALRRIFRGVFEAARSYDHGTIEQLLHLGLIKTPQPRSLGEGDFGEVFESSWPDKVVKITDDPDEAEVAERLVGKDRDGIVRVFSIDRLDSISTDGNPCWALLMERLDRLPEVDSELLNDVKRVPGFYHELTSDVIRRVEEIDPRLGPILDSCLTLGFTPDLHGGNVMQRSDGSWVLADLGPLLMYR